ncbi:MAG: hypothetical protein J7K98_03940 [Candidatus Aenigmarchaeota archaeon]|nr:hypothetical protein [Candidatus Aenigmarchaeota archaeon]
MSLDKYVFEKMNLFRVFRVLVTLVPLTLTFLLLYPLIDPIKCSLEKCEEVTYKGVFPISVHFYKNDKIYFEKEIVHGDKIDFKEIFLPLLRNMSGERANFTGVVEIKPLVRIDVSINLKQPPITIVDTKLLRLNDTHTKLMLNFSIRNDLNTLMEGWLKLNVEYRGNTYETERKTFKVCQNCVEYTTLELTLPNIVLENFEAAKKELEIEINGIRTVVEV